MYAANKLKEVLTLKKPLFYIIIIAGFLVVGSNATPKRNGGVHVKGNNYETIRNNGKVQKGPVSKSNPSQVERNRRNSIFVDGDNYENINN